MRTIFLTIAIALTAGTTLGGCGKGGNAPASGGPAADRASLMRRYLVGTWTREVAGDTVQRRYLAGGTLEIRRYRTPASAEQPPEVAPTTGTWELKDGVLSERTQLPNGDPLTLRYEIETLNSRELILSTQGAEGKIKHSPYNRSS